MSPVLAADRPVRLLSSHQLGAFIDALRTSQQSGRTHDVAWRGTELAAVERMLRDNETAITDAIAEDLGRPRSDVYITDIAPGIAEAAFAHKHVNRWMRPRRTGLPLSAWPGRAKYLHEPLGVVLVIGPWNYPFYLTVAPLVAALAAGNCAVINPSEQAPSSSRLLASPVIVMPDADITVAARRIAWMKFINSGQTCVALDYVLAHRDIRDRLVSAIADTVLRFRAGEPSDLAIVNARQFDRLRNTLASAGGTVVFGGGVDPFLLRIEPTIVIDPDPSSAMMTDEIFGPILPVCTVDGLDTAIRHIDARPKPLALLMFGGKTADRRRVEQATSSGGLCSTTLRCTARSRSCRSVAWGPAVRAPTTVDGVSNNSATAKRCCTSPIDPIRPLCTRPTPRTSWR